MTYRCHSLTVGGMDDAVRWPWPDPKTGPYEVFVRMGELQGRFEVLAVEVRSIGDRLPVTATVLRSLRLGELAAATAERILPLLIDSWALETVSNEADMDEEWHRRREVAVAPMRAAFRRLRDSVKAKAPIALADVASVYREANAGRQHPNLVVAEALGISRNAAAKRAGRARKAALLPKTTRGRASSPSCTVCGDPLPVLSADSLICALCRQEGGTAPGYLDRLEPGELEVAQMSMAKRLERLNARTGGDLHQ